MTLKEQLDVIDLMMPIKLVLRSYPGGKTKYAVLKSDITCHDLWGLIYNDEAYMRYANLEVNFISTMASKKIFEICIEENL